MACEQYRDQKGIFCSHDETTIPFKNFRAFSANKEDSFFPDPLIEFLISFSKGIDVDIEFINLSASFSFARWACFIEAMQQTLEQ
jgi:hypothetical protein